MIFTNTRDLIYLTHNYSAEQLIQTGIDIYLGQNGQKKLPEVGQAYLWIAATFRGSFVGQYNWAATWTNHPKFVLKNKITISNLEKRAKHNDLAALYMLGVYHTQNNPTLAVSYYQQAADQDFYPAINNLADKYENGVGVEQDIAKAVTLYLIAAEHNIAAAEWSLALLYFNGEFVEKDLIKAKIWAKRALENGWLPAENLLTEIIEQTIH